MQKGRKTALFLTRYPCACLLVYQGTLFCLGISSKIMQYPQVSEWDIIEMSTGMNDS